MDLPDCHRILESFGIPGGSAGWFKMFLETGLNIVVFWDHPLGGDSSLRDPGSKSQDPGSRIQIQDPNPGSRILVRVSSCGKKYYDKQKQKIRNNKPYQWPNIAHSSPILGHSPVCHGIILGEPTANRRPTADRPTGDRPTIDRLTDLPLNI